MPTVVASAGQPAALVCRWLRAGLLTFEVCWGRAVPGRGCAQRSLGWPAGRRGAFFGPDRRDDGSGLAVVRGRLRLRGGRVPAPCRPGGGSWRGGVAA